MPEPPDPGDGLVVNGQAIDAARVRAGADTAPVAAPALLARKASRLRQVCLRANPRAIP